MRNTSFRWRADTLLASYAKGSALLAGLLLLLVLGLLVRESWPVLSAEGWRGLQAQGWYPASGQLNLLPMLAATLALGMGALLLALPLGVASAVFVRFYAPVWCVEPTRYMLVLLAGIPSVVFGLWGLTALVPLLAMWQAPGVSLLAATLVLTLMIVPTIAASSEAALAALPKSLLDGGAALGLSQRGIVWGIALPAARTGIFAGVILALMRALGETMAVLMVAGNVVQMPAGLFDPVRALTANIALEMPYATGVHRAALFDTGLLLLGLVIALALWSARMAGKYR
ncbi:phosphate ABC transporter permease subunit PstC [Ferrigenium sp. UT5]|uniref:phosphate ABC transporter permease subunit PstC n=1 Tax=Ferrigenium sp. UT5 TaxID=3242105 RepID=UPI00354FB355